MAAAGHGSIDLEFRGEEIIVLLLNLVDHLWSVNVLSEMIEVDGWQLLGTSGLSIVVVKDGGKLSVLVSGDVSVSSAPKTIKPFSRKLVV